MRGVCLHTSSAGIACILRQNAVLLFNACFGKRGAIQLRRPPRSATPDVSCAVAAPVGGVLRGVARDSSIEGDENRGADPRVSFGGGQMEEHYVGQRTAATAWQVTTYTMQTHHLPVEVSVPRSTDAS